MHLTGSRQVPRLALFLGLIGEIRIRAGPLRVPVSSEPGLGGAGTAAVAGEVPNGASRRPVAPVPLFDADGKTWEKDGRWHQQQLSVTGAEEVLMAER